MFQRSEQRQEAFAQRMSFAAELHTSGIKGEELLSSLYCEFLSGTTRQQGNATAQHVLERVRMFDETRERLLGMEGKTEEEKQALLEKDILDLLDGFTLPSQCRKLHSLNQAMDALADICQGICSPEEMMEQISGYKGRTGETGRNEGLQTVAKKVLDPQQAARVFSGAEEHIFAPKQDWMEDDLYRAILTISVYTMLASGTKTPGGLPVSIEYIALEVCCLVSAQTGKKETPEEAQRRQTVDTAAVKFLLAAEFLAGGTTTVMLAGSAVALYAVYYLTALAVDEQVTSGVDHGV